MPPFERMPLRASPAAVRDGEVVHLINPLWDCHGGSDLRTLEMYRTLDNRVPVRLWSRFTPAAEFRQHFPIELIRPWSGHIPVGGTFVFVGAYFRIGHWFKASFPRRTILVYNTHQPDRLTKVLQRLRAWHRTPVEVVYTSPLLRRLSDPPGVVIESPIDLARFVPAAQDQARAQRRFRIGRLSRDIASKHHDDDPAVYAALSRAGVELRVMGGTCLSGLADLPAGMLLAAGAEPAADFLRGLDCFYYRTSDRWLEAYGRVVFEAMACGLPVVCGREGGYADYIVHGVNGFLVDSSEQAIALLLKLRDDAALRESVGRAARRTIERLYGGASWQRKQAFLTRPPEAVRGAGATPDLGAADPTLSP
jgi:glycosyltransferase involved in cell wall biosynthesis